MAYDDEGQYSLVRIAPVFRHFAFILVFLLSTACIDRADVVIDIVGAGYNQKPALDRAGANERLGDASFGPYLDGVPPQANAPRNRQETVALLQPALANVGQEALLKSDCYWAPSVGETFSATWEQILEVRRAPAHLTCDSPVLVGMCRLTNPDNGDTLKLVVGDAPDVSACPQPEPTIMTISASSADFPSQAFTLKNTDDPQRIVLSRDLAIYEATFSGRTLPANADDQYGLCPSASEFTGPATSTELLSNYCQRSGDDLSPTCATRCSLAGLENAVYKVSIPGISPDLTLLPAIRIVPAGGRTIARQMELVDSAAGTYRWSTPVDGPECNLFVEDGNIPPDSKPYYHCRWHENFSPSVQVASVRLFARDSNGSEQALAPAGPLTVRTYDPPDDDEERWTCNFNSAGAIDDLNNGCEVATGGAKVPLLVTPTYWLDAFDTALALNNQIGAVPLTAPLQWSVDLASAMVPNGGSVFIEFTLRTVTGQALMSVDGALNLGDKRVGHSASGSILLTNIGSAVARVDNLRLMGPDQGDFRYRVLQDRLPPLEIPVEITDRPGGNFAVEFMDGMEDYMSLFEASRGSVDYRLELLPPEEIAWTTAIERGEIAPTPAATRRFTPPGSATVTATVDTRFRENPVVTRAGETLQTTRPLPFTVAPGEVVEIFVDVTPSVDGERWTMLRIEGVDAARPDRHWWVASSIMGFGLYGPDLVMFPGGPIEFPGFGSNPTERNVLLINNGDMAARRTSVAITGPDANRFSIVSQHAAEREIPPGGDETFRLKLSNPCGVAAFSAAIPTASPAWHASLEIDTDEGELSVELLGRPTDCTRRDIIFNRYYWPQPTQPDGG